VSEFGLRAKAKLLARDALGASNLGAALAYAAEGGAGHARVLLVSDGVVTAGVDDSTRLREAVARLAAHGVRRLDVLAEGGITDRETLRVVTQAGLAESGVVLEARAPAVQLADRLRKAVRDRIPVNLAAATWVYPDALESVQPGDERLVFAELPAGVPVQIELVGAGAEAFDTLETPRPLLERAWARAKIEWMTRSLRELPFDADDARAAQERAITELSVQYRVLSDSTAMLVLEGPEEYARYGLSQTALASILRVTDRGLEVWNRREQPVLQIARDFDDQQGLREEPAEGFGSNGRRRGAGAAPDLAAARGALPEAPSALQPTAAEVPKAARAVPRAKGAAFEQEVASLKKQEARPVPASSGAMPPSAAAAPEPARARAVRNEATAMDEAKPAPRRPSAVSTGFGAPGSSVTAPARADSVADMTASVREKAKSSSGAVDGLASLGTNGARPADEVRGAPVPQPALVAAPAQIATDAYEPRLELAVLTASNLPQAEVQRALRGAARTRAKQCFTHSANPASRERVSLVLAVSDKGSVGDAYVAAGSLSDRAAQSCAIQAMHQARLPKPDNGRGSVQVELSWAMRPVSAQRPAVAAKPAVRRAAPSIPAPKLTDAYDGVLADVLARLKDGDTAGALSRASAAHGDDPADVISLVALGEALEAQRDYARAARAYGSLIDLFPSRADLRRMAAERLERLPSDGLSLAVDSYRKAAQQRPDQPSGPRALAYALLKQSDRAQAFETLERALERSYDETRFDGVQRILREDLGLVGAAWLRVDPSAESRVRSSLAAHGAQLAKTPSTRFVLQWETDANDVDFHIYDVRGGHAYYMRPQLPSGGRLYADITTGYGPECFAIEGKSRAYPYVLQAHYFARGPMGYGMGRVQVIDHDGAGNLRFGEFPFVIMKDKAFVELARLDAPLR
jgi:tetratricopeptide (TPR) repeat protein